MRARVALSALILASILPAAAGRSLADQTPQATVTSGWAGIWQVNEETRDCTTGELTGTSSHLDTLCTGDAFTLMAGPILTYGGYIFGGTATSTITPRRIFFSFAAIRVDVSQVPSGKAIVPRPQSDAARPRSGRAATDSRIRSERHP